MSAVCQPTPQRRKTLSTATTQVSEKTPGMTTIPCCYCDQFLAPTNCDTVTEVEAQGVFHV